MLALAEPVVAAMQAHLANLGPRSLAHERPVEEPRPGVEQNWLQRWLLTIGGYYSRESRLLRGAKVLYRGIVEQATHKPLYDGAAVRCRSHGHTKVPCLAALPR